MQASTNSNPHPPRPPQLSEIESAALVLDSYIMHISTHLCACCGNGERFSQIFEVWTHPTQTRLSRYTKLLPLFGMETNKSLEFSIIELPPKPIPFCSDCAAKTTTIFGHSATHYPSRQSWADTLQRKYAPQPQQQPSAKSTPTLDML